MPELLRSAKLAVEKGQSQGRNESYIKQLSDYIIPAVVDALHKVSLFLWGRGVGSANVLFFNISISTLHFIVVFVVMMYLGNMWSAGA